MIDRRMVFIVCISVLLVGALPVAASSIGSTTSHSVSMGESPTADPAGSVTAPPGENVTVVMWANTTNASAYQTNLTFNPDVVQVVAISGSTDFGDPVMNPDNSAGWVAFNQLRQSGISNPVLAEITFQVVGQTGDTSDISFVETDTKLATKDGETYSPGEYGDITIQVEESTLTPTPTAMSTPTPTSTPEPNTPTPTSTPEPNTPTPTASTGGDDGDDSNGGGSGGGGSISTGESQGDVSIVNRMLLNETTTTDAAVVVQADLTNFYPARGHITLNLTTSSTLLTEQTVSVGIDAKRTVYLRAQVETPGRYELRLNGVSVGTVEVAPRAKTATNSPTITQTPSMKSTETRTPSEPKESTAGSTQTDTGARVTPVETTTGSGPGFGVRALLYAIVALMGWTASRRERSS